MKNLLIFSALFSLILFSCGGEEPSEEEYEDNDNVEFDSLSVDTLANDSIVGDGPIYTAEAAIDGPDDELWIFQPGSWEGDVTDPFIVDSNYAAIHVVPYKEYGEGIHDEMSYTNKLGFELWGDFKAYSGPVTVYYDRTKETVSSQFNVVEGKPDGIASIYYPDGAIFMQYRYDNGRWTESIVSPYSHDWKFYQSESKLIINDPISKDNTNEEGLPQHKISYSLHEKGPGDSRLAAVMEKESFENPFRINNKIFTGTLFGYQPPSGITYESIYYELNFVDGWLHGDIKIYSDWFGLTLHERFDMGELDSTVFELDEAEMDGVAKPIIYLYPEKDQKVEVSLEFDGEITHTYPKLNNSWKVLAKPDGTLYDETGKEFYALYWEGDNRMQFDVKEGFCVPGKESAEFLEKSLDILGLNRREANEFIVYWLPVLENNPYNLIHFASDEYEEMAKLNIKPKPETLIRVMMVYKPLSEPINIPFQDLNKLKKERKGFTVVEWGGSLLRTPLPL